MEPGKKRRLKSLGLHVGPAVKYLLWLVAAAWVFSLSIIIDHYWAHYASYESVSESYQQALHEKESAFFSTLQSDVAVLERIASRKYTVADVEVLQKKPFYLYLYQENSSKETPFFWSSNEVVPPLWLVQNGQSGQLFEYGNGQYELLRRRINLNGTNIDALGLVLLHREYFIENQRLKKGFPGFEKLEGRMLFSLQPTSYPIIGVDDKPLFYLQEAVSQPFRFFSWSSFIVQLITTILLIALVSKISNDYINGGDSFAGFLIFCFGFTLLWVAIRWLGVPINLEQFTWLASAESISMPPTELLNLLQNALFVFWLGLFLTFHSHHIGKLLTGVDFRFKALISLLLIVSAVAVHFGIIEKICNLYLSSSVAFDFNNFFSLNYTTAVAFMVMFLMMLAHLMLVRFFARSLMFITGGRIRFVVISLVAGGLLALTVSDVFQFRVQLLFSILWLASFSWYICRYPRAAFPISSGRMVAWLFIYAVSAGILLSFLSIKRLQGRLYDVGKTLMLQNDQTSEYLVRFASGGVRRLDWYNILQLSSDSARSVAIRDSITSKYFGGYLNRFGTELYFFNEKRQPLYNPSSESYESLNTLFQNNPKQEGYPWIAFFEEAYDRFGYIMRFDVEHPETSEPAGRVYVVTRSALTRNAMLAPELFRQLQDFAIDLPAGFSYAWYKQGRLVEQYRNYPFPSFLPAELKSQPSLMQRDGDHAQEVWLNAGSGTYIAISGESNTLIGWVTLVAYIFCAFLLIFLLLRLIGGAAFQARNSDGITFFRPLTLSIQTQIRLTIIAILSVSFVIIAYITINFFIDQFRTSTQEKLSKAAGTVSAELKQDLPNDMITYAPEDRRQLIDESLLKISQSLNADINFYDSTGMLVASTQNILFNREVISKVINPMAYRQLSTGRVHRYLLSETIGNLRYSNIYQPFTDVNGRLIGYLHIPYFASQNELKQEISNFVVILVNIIAFVFLLSGVLALLISGSITRSFSIISEKMDKLKLSEKNERIEWTAKNEIGMLVEQYNKMVDQLEASASKLAQSEREMAWREMARQVAHEIKNPLTPMKLSLQFLQKAIKENNENVVQITERVASNLVSQIDHLAKIAYEFSQFANIGKAQTQVFDLHEVLKELLHLYALQENLHVTAYLSKGPVYINADKTQINRLFTNLLQNATEAADHADHLKVTLVEKLISGKILIEVKDNGPGIPEEIQPKIFMPNFTTKSSGTGLGLAICKAIVEKAGGEIWFKTEAGVGTSFFVELPTTSNAPETSDLGKVTLKMGEL